MNPTSSYSSSVRPTPYSKFASSTSTSTSNEKYWQPLQIVEDDVSRIDAEAEAQTTISARNTIFSYERRNMLQEVVLPLNNSGSKTINIGLDPFYGFMPMVRIQRKSDGRGISFNAETFNAFTGKLEFIIGYCKISETGRTVDLIDYTVHILDKGVVKFAPKSEGNFALYIAGTTLSRLFDVGDGVLHIIEDMEKKSEKIPYDEFRKDVAHSLIAHFTFSAEKATDAKIMDAIEESDFKTEYYEFLFKYNTYLKVWIDSEVSLKLYNQKNRIKKDVNIQWMEIELFLFLLFVNNS